MVKALRQDPMHSPHIYRHGFQAALPFGACRSTTVAPDSVPRFSSHLLSFSGSARNAELPLFYHNQIESVSRFLFHVELAAPSKSQHRKHLLGEGFRDTSAPEASFGSLTRAGERGGRGVAAAHWPWDALRFTSVLSSARVPALPRSAAPAPFQRAPSRCHGNAQGASTPSLSGQTRARRASHSGLLPRPFCPSFVAEIPLSGAIPSRPPAPRPRP